VLVTAQIALAVVLLTGAALLVTSLVQVLRVDPGFDAARVVAFDVSLPQSRVDTWAKRDDLLTRIVESVRGVPGVTAACAINTAPFDEDANMTYVPDGQSRPVSANPRNVTRGCFDVLGIELRAGRQFAAVEHTRVAIVTESFARAAWPGANPIGQRVHLGVKDGPLIEIVGVVADSRQRSLERQPYPQFYEAASESSAFWPSRVIARTGAAPAAIFGPVRDAVRRVDRDQPVARLRALSDAIGSSTSARRFDLSLVSGFAVIALTLAAVGVYGLLSQIVAQRRQEIGIRLALGATTRSVTALVKTSAWWAVAAGVAAGAGAAALASRVLRQFMFGISTTDPRIYVGVAATLTIVALLAAWLPARRAARIDPLSSMRLY
jgi:predicted permease